jgi:hypothetical protein
MVWKHQHILFFRRRDKHRAESIAVRDRPIGEYPLANSFPFPNAIINQPGTAQESQSKKQLLHVM